MPRRDQFKWLGNQCIDELTLDGLSKLSTIASAFRDFLPAFGHVFGKAASPHLASQGAVWPTDSPTHIEGRTGGYLVLDSPP